MSDDFMPMGMPPVMVDYEDFSQFMAQEDRIKSVQSQNTKLREALEKIIEPLELYISENSHNVPIDPHDEHSDTVRICSECRVLLDESHYDEGCEIGWISEALDIAQQALEELNGNDPTVERVK